MPIYEYKCRDCGAVTEVFVRSPHQKTDIFCTDCRSRDLVKIFSTPSAVMIGSKGQKGTTCCGRTERCETPPCHTDDTCRRG